MLREPWVCRVHGRDVHVSRLVHYRLVMGVVGYSLKRAVSVKRMYPRDWRSSCGYIRYIRMHRAVIARGGVPRPPRCHNSQSSTASLWLSITATTRASLPHGKCRCCPRAVFTGRSESSAAWRQNSRPSLREDLASGSRFANSRGAGFLRTHVASSARLPS